MFTIKFIATVLLTVTCNVIFSGADVQNNPFLVGASLNTNEPSLKPKDINQWNVAVVLPPGGQFPEQPPQLGQPPVVASPGFIWLQVPASYFSNKLNSSQKPLDVGQVHPPAYIPSKEPLLPQSPPSSVNPPVAPGIQQPIVPTTIPGSELNKQCLKPTGQFPSAICNKFINCWNGVAVEQACPEGLLFSAKGLHCDYPENVDCSKRPIVDIPRPPIPPPTVPAPIIQTTQVPVIQTQVPVTQTTQIPVIQTTKVPVTQTTQVPVIQTTQALPSLIIGGELNKKCLKPRGQFPAAACNTYVNCWDGTAIEQFCPGEQLFNPIKNYCDFSENVNCNGKPIVGSPPASVPPSDAKSSTASPTAGQSSPAPTTSGASPATVSPPTNGTVSTVDPALRKKCLKPRGQFPSTSCNKFVNCWDDVVLEQECPEGFLFSTKGYCDSADIVDCGDRKTKPRETASELECPLESGTFREKNKCNSYYTCISNKVVARYVCPEGLNYNDNIGVCDYPFKVDCSKEPLVFQGGNNQLECPLESGTFRDKNKCNSFYTCISNKVVANYECPEGFNFNDNIGVCDYAHRVDCSQEPLVFQGRSNMNFQSFRSLSNDNFVPVTKNENVEYSECSVDFGTFRDSKNCSSYYTCFSRRIVAKYDCPAGFSFNDDIGVCDYAAKVDCTKPPKIYQVTQNSMPQLPDDFKEKIDSCKPGTVFRLNPQCTSACFCRNGLAEIIQCPAGLAYDSRVDKCILPHLARC